MIVDHAARDAHALRDFGLRQAVDAVQHEGLAPALWQLGQRFFEARQALALREALDRVGAFIGRQLFAEFKPSRADATVVAGVNPV